MLSRMFGGGDPDKKKNLAERFAIETNKCLGKGGYGVTYAASDRSTGEPLACKVIDTRRMKVDAIRKETQILEVLSHRNIISVQGHDQGFGPDSKHAHLYFIFMELASGGELFDQVIDRGANAMPEEVARNFFCQMLDGVNYCHLAGVAHRDLKLENVLLNSAGVVKLIDFGLSHVYPVDPTTRVVDRSKPLRDICGSKSYAAPDVLAGQGYDGYAADMWSLGVCLFAMLSGFFPLDEASHQDWRYGKLAAAQGRGESTVAAVYGFYHRSHKHLSPAVVHLLDGLLQIDPAKRMTMAQVREHPWATGKDMEGKDAGGGMDIEGDAPLYRGMGAVPSTWQESDVDVLDEDAPVCTLA